jgi:signal transduction histidine kinase
MELHDELGQALAALKLQIRVMKNEFSGSCPYPVELANEWLDRFRTDINEIIESVRRLSRNLSPIIIDDLGIDAALANIVHNFTEIYGITCTYQPESLGVIKTTDGQRLVYRLVQETLNNIGKHSEATHVVFTIIVEDNQAVLKLTDNGKGFDLREIVNRGPEHKGIGLAAMRERTNMLGGTIEIDSNVGSGTTVSFTIPLDTDQFRKTMTTGNGS